VDNPFYFFSSTSFDEICFKRSRFWRIVKYSFWGNFVILISSIFRTWSDQKIVCLKSFFFLIIFVRIFQKISFGEEMKFRKFSLFYFCFSCKIQKIFVCPNGDSVYSFPIWNLIQDLKYGMNIRLNGIWQEKKKR